jgi:hypothetical protein
MYLIYNKMHIYEMVFKIFRTGAVIYTAVVAARSIARTTMSSKSMCQVARTRVEVGSFRKRLFGVVYLTRGGFHVGSKKGTASVHRICSNLEKSATETLTMIQQAFGYQILSRMGVFKWHARFKNDRTSFEDDEHTGRPTSFTTPETVARIQELVHSRHF